MSRHPGADFDPLDMTPGDWPKPGGGGPDQPVVDAVTAYEAAHARGGWDQPPHLLWVRHPPGGPATLGPIPVPPQLLHGSKPYLAATYLAQVLARLGSAAAVLVPAHVVAVALLHEVWAVPRPEHVDPAELAHLKTLRDQRKLYTRPERIEMRQLNCVDLPGNECDVLRVRGTGGHADQVEVQTWPAARATRYRGDVIDAVRELARMVAALAGVSGPPPDFRTVFGLN